MTGLVRRAILHNELYPNTYLRWAAAAPGVFCGKQHGERRRRLCSLPLRRALSAAWRDEANDGMVVA